MRALVPVAVLAAFAACLGPGEASPTASPTATSQTPGFSCGPGLSFETDNVSVSIETSKGRIRAVLYGHAAPLSVCNFLRYVAEDFYDGTIWHRVCQHVVQAGGWDPYLMQQKATHVPIKNEANASHHRNYKGTLGMARNLNDPDSATSHFYVNLRDNVYLDWDSTDPRVRPGFAVFGNTTEGWDVVQAIAATPTVPDPPDMGCQGVPAPGTATTITDVRLDA